MKTNNGYFTWRPITGTLHKDLHTFLIISRSFLLRMRNLSDKRRENQNTHFVFSNFLLFRISFRLWHNVEKYCRTGQATYDSMAHAHPIMHTEGYKRTLTICNTYYFSTTTMAARTQLNATCTWRVLLLPTAFEFCSPSFKIVNIGYKLDGADCLSEIRTHYSHSWQTGWY